MTETTQATQPTLYAEVLLAVRFKDLITYSIPDGWRDQVVPGSLVRVSLVGRLYTGVVLSVSETPNYRLREKIIPIKEITPFPPLSAQNLAFIHQVATYYLCSPGDVFRAAAPSTVKALKSSRKRKGTDSDNPQDTPTDSRSKSTHNFSLPNLTEHQQKALNQIRQEALQGKTVLLNGVTGSGKTELYIHLIAQALEAGKNALYLLPEIALSRQLENRLKQIFGDHLMVYHSKQTPARRRTVYETVANNPHPYVVLGLRSALFLPFKNLDTIIVDEEHDSSYKQKEPAPRYHGRDAALFLAKIHQAKTVLGSATPSLESLYNVLAGRFAEVRLEHRFYGGSDCPIRLVDMCKERRKRAVKGSLSLQLIRAIQQRLDRGEQCLVFRSRRAYATWVECPECGHNPKCPHCNVSLSYHKAANRLSCHYCGHTTLAEDLCPACGQGHLQKLGNGTERIEEELKALFPQARIARFDADTTANKTDEEHLLRQFEQKQIDILVGTQMISKGFDFESLTLTAVIQAEALTTLFDFRADERAIQLLTQLRGRAGRRNLPGEMLIQTTQPEHSVFQWTENPNRLSEEQTLLLNERQTYGFPPFVRMVVVTLRDKDPNRLQEVTNRVGDQLRNIPNLVVSGPTPPPIDRIQGEFLQQFHLKVFRNREQENTKKQIRQVLVQQFQYESETSYILDVDPL